MWWCGNENGECRTVADLSANDFGLHDMHGNLSEWVHDWWQFHLGFDPQTDPSGPGSGTDKVTKGGGWDSNASFCRSGARGASNPNYRGYYIGFRLARSP
jgi:formylglycine-generating enzyme required for sulfatase activity